MALYFLETSALVKLYVRERGTDSMLRIVTAPGDVPLAVLSLSVVEFRSALRRRERMGDIDTQAASEICQRFDAHVESRFLRQPLTDGVIELALQLIDDHPLRAYDAVQLAACLTLHRSVEPVFCSADGALLDAARVEGVRTFNPLDE